MATGTCGNGIVEGTEACDDGNTVSETTCATGFSCTGCSATCDTILNIELASCGDGICNGTETNTSCSTDCSLTGGAICGNFYDNTATIAAPSASVTYIVETQDNNGVKSGLMSGAINTGKGTCNQAGCHVSGAQGVIW